MEQLTLMATRDGQRLTRLTRNARIFKTIIQAIQDKKGDYIISLDLRKIPEAVSDFFIICSAGSGTQVKAIANFIEEKVSELCGENPYKQEGQQSAQWVLIDYVNVVVHVMLTEPRNFYRLEEMWSDAPQLEHNEE